MKKKPFGYWRSKENRIRETRQLVKKLNKKPKEIQSKDFRTFKIEELLKKAGGVRSALIEAGFDVKPFNKKKELSHSH